MLDFRRNYCKRWFVVATVSILFSAHANAAEEVSLQLRWIHQFQFAGYYAAKEKGFYQEAGINVTIVAGGPGKIAIEEVTSGAAQYGVANHEILLNRLRGKPVVALAAIFQHSPQVFMARQDSEIYSPHDLVGRRVMTIGGEPDAGLVAMLRSEGVNLDQVEIVKSSFNINDLVDGKTDVFNSYLTNEPFLMKQKGIPYTILNPAKYGVDFYSDILFTTEGEIAKHPDRVKNFREASLRGWVYAMENPEEIIEIILNKYSIKKTREHLLFEAGAMSRLIMPEFVDMGHINPHRWRIMIDAFKEIGVIKDESNLEGLIYDPARLMQERRDFVVNMLLAALAATIIGGALLWNVLLRRTVSVRTQELLRSESELRLARDNLEIKVAERTAELQSSEERFRDFSNVASDWFWETDEENRFSYFSEQFEVTTGINPQTLLGKKREEERPSGMVDEAWQALLEDMAARRGFRNVTLLRRRPNGEDVWMRVNGIPHYNKSGHFKGYRCTGTDITNEVEATNETQHAQRLLYSAIEVLEDGFVLFDAEDRLVLSNQKYRDMYHEVADVLKPGTTFTEIIQVSAERLQVIDSLDDKDEWLKERLERHQNPTTPFDMKLTRGDWVRVIEQKTAEGGIVGLRIDITKEKQEEQELRKLSHALEQSPSMIFITDVEGTIEYINPMFTKISGYAADEVIGKTPSILKSGETPLDVYADLWRTIKSGHDWRGELKDRCKDGSTFWAYAIISPVTNEKGEITNFVSMHEDITQRKEIEVREHKAMAQAEIANRAKSELLANMSHELRTRLNAIIGFSESMKVETFGPVGSDKNREYLDDIHQSGQHLLGLINDILDVSAIEAGALELGEENVNIADVVEASVRLIRPRADFGQVNVASTIDPEIPLIYSDARRVKQVFLNLLSNAVKFTPKGGEVTVSARLNEDGSLAVAVADTGIGMDEEEVTKALSTFGQVDSGLDRKHEGTGLGLPLTKGLMELHGGTLEIESEKGHGSLITVTFPKERVIQNA